MKDEDEEVEAREGACNMETAMLGGCCKTDRTGSALSSGTVLRLG